MWWTLGVYGVKEINILIIGDFIGENNQNKFNNL